MTQEILQNRNFHSALKGGDYGGIAAALANGADPNSQGRCTEGSFTRSLIPIEFAVRRNLSKKILQLLLDKGAAIAPIEIKGVNGYSGKPAQSNHLLSTVLSSNNLMAFEVLTQHPRFVGEKPSPEQWSKLFDTKKPSLWTEKFIEKWGMPDQEMAAKLLGIAMGRGDTKCMLLLLDESRPLSNYLFNHYVVSGMKKAHSAKFLFEKLLPAEPSALDLYKERFGATLMASLLSEGIKPKDLADWLEMPESSQMLQSDEDHACAVSACLRNLDKVSLDCLFKVGVRMPIVEHTEELEGYFTRIAQIDDRKLRGLLDKPFLRDLWALAQAHTMARASQIPTARSVKHRL